MTEERRAQEDEAQEGAAQELAAEGSASQESAAEESEDIGTGDITGLRGEVIASLDEHNRAWGDLQRRGERLEDVSRELGERVQKKKPQSTTTPSSSSNDQSSPAK